MKKTTDPFSAIRGPSPSVVAEMFGTSVDRVRQQYRTNSAQLRKMANKAASTGKPINGYSAESLFKLAESALAKSKE